MEIIKGSKGSHNLLFMFTQETHRVHCDTPNCCLSVCPFSTTRLIDIYYRYLDLLDPYSAHTQISINNLKVTYATNNYERFISIINSISLFNNQIYWPLN